MPPVKIVLTGAESTGKTTLAMALAQRLPRALWVPEWARQRVTQLQASGLAYDADEVERIARRQLDAEDAYAAQPDTDWLFCDTDLITCKIWLEYRYGYCPLWIAKGIAERPYTLHVLCAPDIPWEPDPLRENPNEREELHFLYKQTLLDFGKPFVEVSGTVQERMVSVLEHLFSKNKAAPTP